MDGAPARESGTTCIAGSGRRREGWTSTRSAPAAPPPAIQNGPKLFAPARVGLRRGRAGRSMLSALTNRQILRNPLPTQPPTRIAQWDCLGTNRRPV